MDYHINACPTGRKGMLDGGRFQAPGHGLFTQWPMEDAGGKMIGVISYLHLYMSMNSLWASLGVLCLVHTAVTGSVPYLRVNIQLVS